MRRFLTALLVSSAIFCCLPAHGQAVTTVPVTGNLSQILGTPSPYAGLKIDLENCPAPISIPGQSVVVQTEMQVSSDASGVVTSNVWPTDKIDCNGTTGNAQYGVQYIVNGVPTADTVCYSVLSTAGVWNLNTTQPVACNQTPPNPQDLTVNNLVVNGVLTGTANISNLNATSVTAAITNNICNAYAQNTSSASGGINACMALLPSSGGIVDATGYAGNQTIAGLTITKSITLLLGAATFDVTGVINATNLPDGIIIRGQGKGTVLTGDTGSGKPVLDLMGSSNWSIEQITINGGTSTIGILQGRTSSFPNAGWHSRVSHIRVNIPSNHAANTVFSQVFTLTSGSSTATPTSMTGMFPGLFLTGTGLPAGTMLASVGTSTVQLTNAATVTGSQTVTGSAGTVGIYNNGSEVNEYQTVTSVADIPAVFSASNIYNVTPPNVPFYTGFTTMEAARVDGKSDFYGTAACLVLDNAATFYADMGECDGAQIPGSYGVIVHNFTNNVTIHGEFENFPRAVLIDGFSFNSNFDFACANCQATAWTGTLTLTNASITATPSVMTNIALGDVITATGVPRGTVVTAIGASTITMSSAATVGGAQSANMMEPLIVLDGNNTNVDAIDVSHSKFNVFGNVTPSYETYFIESYGGHIAPSTGWVAHLPVGTSILWASGNPFSGDVYLPAEGSFSYPLMPSNLTGYVHDQSGTTLVNTTNYGGSGCLYPFYGLITSSGAQAPYTSSSSPCYNQSTATWNAPSYSIGGSVVIPNSTTGPHGNGAKIQFSDNTGTAGHYAKYDANGNVTDGGATAAGTATLVAGTVTVSNSAACAIGSTCHYQLTHCVAGGTVGTLSVGTITAGTSFVINSSSATDTSQICWQIN
ncbi:MAG: hypothetical protein KGL39_27510 [Patescibacteria group bacterium]|nr:hypothetical protein [Patescibacteria group bacterium]